MGQHFEDESTTSLADKAYKILREEIILGRQSMGYPILEQEIATRLGMSRTPVRAAIERLKHDGLVEIIRRKGVMVKSLTITDVEQTYEMNEALEGMVVKLATLRASDDELAQLQEILRGMERTAKEEDLLQWAAFDKQFHQKLLELARNPLIFHSLERVVVTVLERVRFINLSVRSVQESTNDHIVTMSAILARDEEKARKLHQDHLQRVRNEIITLLRSNLGREMLIR